VELLITGSEGLVGRSVVKALRSAGHEVTTFDLCPSVSNETKHYQADVRDIATVGTAMEGVDGVVHLAAVSRVRWGRDFPLACASVNIMGTTAILEAARRASNRPFLVVASSREVYGTAEHFPVCEDAPLRPCNLYGATKASSELLCESYSREYGLRVMCLRLSNVYGDPLDYSDRVVPRFIISALLGQDLVVRGPDHVYDFTHLNDTTDAVCRAVERHSMWGDMGFECLHIVSGTPTSLKELAKTVVELVGSSSSIRFAHAEGFFPSKFWGDTAKAKNLLGYRPRVSLEKGIADLETGYREMFDQQPDLVSRLLNEKYPSWLRQLSAGAM